ncbi:hypothetical protein DFP72DRAFT_881346 [Ephemerocybe angulata]|uniref:Fungal-type protein kinase domain-containing protein n=1 Tax=Ephemerocybe angulata TaxID=980116 RepID=A0A8H6IBC7_9AGAR|nr:hypothetical protein DFP72DRAFT_881346 [Tulosesus angulatus]
MRPSATVSRKQHQSRIYWTRSRTRAAQAAAPTPTELPNSSPLNRTSPASALRNTISLHHEPPQSVLRMKPLHNPTDSPLFYGPADPHSRLRLEIGDEIKIVSEAWMHSLYGDLVNPASIDNFLASTTSGYRQSDGCWEDLSPTPASKEALLVPLRRILARIHSNLGEPCEKGVSRELVSSRASIAEVGGFRPVICVKGVGPSFEPPRETDISYCDLASVIDIELDKEVNDPDRIVQAALYSKYIFMTQPNRNFVRTLIVTERSFRLVHHDRSGFYVSPLINMHQHPHTFVRVVLGLSSPREAVLGFDTSVQWTCDPKTGRKSAGTIETVDENGQTIVYQLQMDRPPLIREALCGRGTTCWYATHPDTGEEVLIKDAWREADKPSEFVFLKAARGVEGVVQMHSFQDRCAETKAYRPSDFVWKDSVSRIKSRVVMQVYGRSLEHFTSRFQAISALRDAIHGHRGLLAKSILHRDVSLQNILMSIKSGAAPGARGTLIDLDMAAWTHTDISVLRAEVGIGTRRFQSTAVLRNMLLKFPPVHDHLDDIESFFYVLCHLILLFESPGKRIEERDEQLSKLEMKEPEYAADMRGSILYGPWCCSPWWGKATEELLTGFQAFLIPMVRQKNVFRQRYSCSKEERRDLLEAFGKENGVDVYDKVLKLFDTALAAYEREDRAAEGSALPPTAPLATVDPSTTSKLSSSQATRKRRSEEDHPDVSPSKRVRSSPNLKVVLEVEKVGQERHPSARSPPIAVAADTAAPPPCGPSKAKPRAPPKRRTRAQGASPKPVRRSARLNRA